MPDLIGLKAKLIAAGAIALAVLAALFGIYRAGRRAERSAINDQNLEVKDAQLKSATRRPRDRSQLIERLRGRSF